MFQSQTLLRKATRVDSAAQNTFFEYDAAGRQTAVITTEIHDPDSTNPTANTHPDQTEYDDLGRRIATHEGIKQAYPTDASSIDRTYEQTTNYEYDKAGNLTAVILPAVPHPTLLDAQNHPLMVLPLTSMRTTSTAIASKFVTMSSRLE